MASSKPRKNSQSHYPRSTPQALDIKQRQLNEYLVARYSARPSAKPRRSKPRIVARYSRKHVRGKVVRGEALDFLRTIADRDAALVFLDPPFNLGKRYGNTTQLTDQLPQAQYQMWFSDVLAESARILAPGGALYLYHLPLWAMRFGPSLERFLDFRQWIAISMKNGFVSPKRLYPAHYALLCFTKGTPLTFERPKIQPAACRHCGKLVKDYGGYLSLIEKNGLNLSDVWDDLSPVRHAKLKFRSANELPRSLFHRIMTMSGIKDGLYVDPFAGSGSGVMAAIEHGMHFAAADLGLKNCRLLQQRIAECRCAPPPKKVTPNGTTARGRLSS